MLKFHDGGEIIHDNGMSSIHSYKKGTIVILKARLVPLICLCTELQPVTSRKSADVTAVWYRAILLVEDVHISKYMLAGPPGLAQADLVCESHGIKQVYFFFYCFFSSRFWGSKGRWHSAGREMCLPGWPMLVEILIWLWKWHIWPLLWNAGRLSVWWDEV